LLDSVGWLCARADDLLRAIKAFYPDMDTAADARPQGYRLDNPRIRIDPSLKAGFMELVRYLNIDERPSLNKRLVSTFDEAKTALATIESRELATIHQYWVEEYREHYDEALLDRIEDGQICTAAKAERAAAVHYDVRLTFARFFERYDYLILPVAPTPTLEKGDWTNQMEADLRRLNAPASLSALPALILPFPCGRSRYGAAQLILNPRKIYLCEAILEQVSRFYAR
jgi:Asp-tRNA(Asn)/Glu-tRNA(Gln) amidotransferase A subunit family amidase